MDYDLLLELVKRGGPSAVSSRPDPDEYIDKIIEVARWRLPVSTCSPGNLSSVKKPALRDKVVEYITAYWGQAKMMESTREPWQGKPWKTSGVLDAGMTSPPRPVYIILFGDARNQGRTFPWGSDMIQTAAI